MKIMELYTQRKISEKMMNINMLAVIFFFFLGGSIISVFLLLLTHFCIWEVK